MLGRFGSTGDSIHYWEEPLYEQTPQAFLRYRTEGRVTVLQAVIPSHLKRSADTHVLRALLDTFLAGAGKQDVLWYYTPMALEFSHHLKAARVYDCMDELSMFAGAPPQLRRMETELLRLSDVVFTGGKSLYYNKRRLHENVHCFPSAVDERHFSATGAPEPSVLQGIARPRIGFYGVLDERLDRAFVAELARELPDWNIVLVGPVVKVDPQSLPAAPNIHYTGMQPYEALPALLEHWDIALLPFALNDATRYISPTKTLEYLAAGKRVISTPIADVVDPYATQNLVDIASTGRQAAQAARAIAASPPDEQWRARVRTFVAGSSWDATVASMRERIGEVVTSRLERVG